MTINFLLFWSVPIIAMGSVYKQLLKPFIQPAYKYFDNHPLLREFSQKYIYNNQKHSDFFFMSLCLLLNCCFTIPFMFYWQLSTGKLPFWLIGLYYCSWVGLGGTIMGGAYGLAHKEGHNHGLYKKWLRQSVGNFFENWLGLFFGNVPYNFTTSHVFIHHRLDGGIGDTFYEWDFDRSSFLHFMLYVHRILLHMLGISSIKWFRANNMHSKADKLEGGVRIYVVTAVFILLLTRSPNFLFWIYIQPLLCMTYFLALINIGFHGFVEYDANGKSIPTVNSATIIDGEDDMFGEDDHMAHHYNASVYYKDLPAHQKSQIDEYRRTKASVFQKLSIVELSIYIVFGLWDKLADHYVDYTNNMSRQEIIEMLKRRARLCEISYENYIAFCKHPTLERKNSIKKFIYMRNEKAA